MNTINAIKKKYLKSINYYPDYDTGARVDHDRYGTYEDLRDKYIMLVTLLAGFPL